MGDWVLGAGVAEARPLSSRAEEMLESFIVVVKCQLMMFCGREASLLTLVLRAWELELGDQELLFLAGRGVFVEPTTSS